MSVAIDTLISSAGDPERRGEAIRSLVDMFVAVDGPASGREKRLLNDIVERVIDDYEAEVRRDISEALSYSERTPQPLARRLARDEIDIARPILERSPVLSEDDLVEITNEKNDDYRVAIASRDRITERVSDALISKGGIPVIRKVAGNEGAELSSFGVTKIVEKAADDEETIKNLSDRKNLNAEANSTLKEKVSTILATRLRDVSPDATIESLASVALQRIESEVTRKNKQRVQLKVLISEISRGERSLDEAVIMLCPSGRIEEVTTIMAALSELSENLVTGLIRAKDPAPLMILCRFLDMGRDAFASLAQAYCKRKGQSLGYVRTLMGQYSQITGAEARRTIILIKLRERTMVEAR